MGSSDDLQPTRSISLFGKKKDAGPKLPPNWKKAKDKEGKVYYFNSVTQQKTHEIPPSLPKVRARATPWRAERASDDRQQPRRRRRRPSSAPARYAALQRRL
jgi:hypothetical protein